MTTPNTPSQSPQAAVPKDTNVRAASPPPAYTPRRTPNIAAMIAQGIPGYRIQHFFPQAEAQHATLESAADDEEEEDSASKSPISLRINSSINISSNNNIICIESTPSENANAIAQAVAKAILEGSSGRCGIPMIDENGVPRPLMIEVDAGMVIEGANNIVGSRAAVNEVLKHRNTPPLSLRRPREEHGDDQTQPAAKRRRSQ
ncbi:hypothetical protein B0T10DRAFT_109308 [Thelonectria olida]|uniref:Uncharacterized protein n=1 Tax=Thelonectria olida TaxID=1576542 RepID=A0A9P8WDZ2_9HYPO|nr:hypothetical protein B0T10DRAFT_109308 [Thelonectria olida]